MPQLLALRREIPRVRWPGWDGQRDALHDRDARPGESGHFVGVVREQPHSRDTEISQYRRSAPVRLRIDRQPEMDIGLDSDGFLFFFGEVCLDPAVIAQLRARRATARRSRRNLDLAVGVERIVERAAQAQLLVIVRRRHLHSPDHGINPRRLRSTRPAGRDIGIKDDPSHLHERRVTVQTVPREHHLKGALTIRVTILGTAHIERSPIERRGIGVCLHEDELGIGVNVPTNQPGARCAVDMEILTRDPSHRGASSSRAAASRKTASASSHRARSVVTCWASGPPK